MLAARFGRRGFLVASGAALGAVSGIAGRATPAAAASAPAPDYRSWAAVRDAFPLRREAVHFTSFLLSPHPRPVAAAIDATRRAIDRDPEGYLAEHQSTCEERVVRAAAAYTGGKSGEIALTDSTTMGVGLLYGGLRLSPGDEILTSTHEFYSTHRALRMRAQGSGVRVRRIGLYHRLSTVSTDELVSSVAESITQRTRVLALTWVHSSTGLKLPIAEIARAVDHANRDRDERERVLFCVDGVHGFGNQDVAVAKLGCDFFVSGCHKWLFGPRGTGLIWGRHDAWKRVSPTIPSFDTGAMRSWLHPFAGPPVPPGAAMTPGGFHSFEHRWALDAAFGFHEAIGRARVATRTRTLVAQLTDGLAGLPNVTVRTPRSPELSAGLVCFDVAGFEAPAAVEELKRKRILASVTPYAVQYVRLGPSVVNSPDEVEEALRAIRGLR